MRAYLTASIFMAAVLETRALRCIIVPGNGCTGRVADANW